jgi:ribokinase
MGRVAVVGHVEWMTFAMVDRVPGSGDIAHASETWADAGGGGGVAARQLAKLAGSCDFFTALGDDALGRRSAARLTRAKIEVLAARREEPTREGLCLIDESRERTIITLGRRLEPKGL